MAHVEPVQAAAPRWLRWVCFGLLALSCDRGDATKPQTSPPKPTASAAGAATAPTRKLPGCRIISISGVGDDARTSGGLERGQLLDASKWLRLPAKARISLKHSKTGREFSLLGSTISMPCYVGEEAVVLAKGQLRTTAGPGTRPGAQVWIFTPAASVIFAEADLEIEISASEGRVRVGKGSARVIDWQHRPEDKGAVEIRSGSEHRWQVPASFSAQAALKRCEEAAVNTLRAGRAVLKPNVSLNDRVPHDLGTRTATHMRARNASRHQCGMARATLFHEEDPEKRATMETALRAAEQKWRRLPRPTPPSR